MKYQTVLERLKSYRVPGDWPPTIFLLPEGAMKDIYDCIVSNGLRSCVELGTGHGATSCVMAAAVDEVGPGGRVVTIDKTLHLPVNANVLKEHVRIGDNLDFVVEPLGYNWYLADLIVQQTVDSAGEPLFDFCLIDGAHEFEADALAFTLAAKLLRPGGWVVLDDINFHLRSMAFWQKTHGHLSDRELDTCQIGIVYNYIVRQMPDFIGFKLTEHGRVGWARKRPVGSQQSQTQLDDSLDYTNREGETVHLLRAQLFEKSCLAKQLQSQLEHSEAQLSKVTATLAWRLMSAYGRRVKYPYLLPIYRMLGLAPSESANSPGERISETPTSDPEDLISEKASPDPPRPEQIDR